MRVEKFIQNFRRKTRREGTNRETKS